MQSLHQLQQAFLDLRFGMFLHFNMATFQDREWGDPTGPREAFAPSAMDTDQWASAAKAAGMTYACLTAKHHDGFCIWHTQTTADRTSGVDVVGAYAESFRRQGLRLGLYFSILDLRADIRHFNITPAKIQLIKDQLTELLSNYGEIDLLVIDGWDAPWSRITYEEIPFREIYDHIKKLQPNCLISELNASQYPESALYYNDIKAFEQNAGQMLPDENKLPSQSCVTLTDGWFWKTSDVVAELKSVAQIVDEWLVPQNNRHCNLLLNAPPNREGKLAPNVVARLEEIGHRWQHAGPAGAVERNPVITTRNLATGQRIVASDSPDTVGPDMANDGDFDSAWSLPEGQTAGWLELEWPEPREFNTIVLVSTGVDSYRIPELCSVNAPAPVDIQRVRTLTIQRIRIELQGPAVTVSEVGVYFEPGPWEG